MRVMYAANRFPKFSESYIAAEINYAQKRGIEVVVASLLPWTSEAVASCPVVRGQIGDLLDTWRPDIFHVHYSFPGTWNAWIAEAAARGIPVTVRAHRFPNELDGIDDMTRNDDVKAIFVFPRFAREFDSPKVIPMPVAYDSHRFADWKMEEKDRRLVVRTVAGRPHKGLEDFMVTSRKCPLFRFVLVVDSGGWEGKAEELARYLDARVEIRSCITDREVAALMKEAAIYLSTSDPEFGAPFGMPISLAEAMGAGCLTVARNVPGMLDYLGPCSALYETTDQAARIINATMGWTPQQWWAAARLATEQAVKYHDGMVLPVLLETWRKLAMAQNSHRMP